MHSACSYLIASEAKTVYDFSPNFRYDVVDRGLLHGPMQEWAIQNEGLRYFVKPWGNITKKAANRATSTASALINELEIVNFLTQICPEENA